MQRIDGHRTTAAGSGRPADARPTRSTSGRGPRADARGTPPTPDDARLPPLGGLFGGDLSEKLGQLGRAAQQRFAPELTPERKAALKTLDGLLTKDKLGGANEAFDLGDRDAIVKSLMKDTKGLKAEVQEKLRAEGKGFQADLVGKGLDGSWNPLAAMARKQVYAEAPGEIGAELDKGLREAGVDPKTGARQDGTARTVNFEDLRRFESAARTLQSMQKEAEAKLGVRIRFPDGISRAAIQHTLEGRLGFPPGAKLEPLARD